MSEIKSVMWNTVVAGKWNPAILTPKGIAEHIFNKTDDTPIEVLVPLDAMGPPRVRIEGFFVSANFDRLVIDCEKNNWESLEKSRDYCCNAINALPKTPVSAAGFNIRYEIEEPTDGFLELLKPPLDDSISDNQIEIVKRETRRALVWKGGTINLHIVKQKSSNYIILLNFDMKSIDNISLKDWLNIPIETVKAMTKTIMCSVLKSCMEDEI